jgi:hypothetical protein
MERKAGKAEFPGFETGLEGSLQLPRFCLRNLVLDGNVRVKPVRILL